MEDRATALILARITCASCRVFVASCTQGSCVHCSRKAGPLSGSLYKPLQTLPLTQCFHLALYGITFKFVRHHVSVPGLHLEQMVVSWVSSVPCVDHSAATLCALALQSVPYFVTIMHHTTGNIQCSTIMRAAANNVELLNITCLPCPTMLFSMSKPPCRLLTAHR